MSKQTEAVGMIKTMGWWETVIRRAVSMMREEVSGPLEADDQYISDTMLELINEIEPLLPDDDNQVTNSMTFKHKSGKHITFYFQAEITHE